VLDVVCLDPSETLLVVLLDLIVEKSATATDRGANCGTCPRTSAEGANYCPNRCPGRCASASTGRCIAISASTTSQRDTCRRDDTDDRHSTHCLSPSIYLDQF
jgi:hypothetical protein